MMVVHEVFRQLDVENSHIVSDLLVADDAELHHVDCSTNLSLTLAPFDKSRPNEVIGCLTDDASHCIGVATEVSLNCFVTEKFNIKVAIATWFIHIHSKVVLVKKF